MPKSGASLRATGPLQPANQEIQNMIEKVKDVAMARANAEFERYEAHSYASQMDDGVNHFVKVRVGGGSFLHLRIHEPLPPNHRNFQLQGMLSGLTEQEPIVCFGDETPVLDVDR